MHGNLADEAAHLVDYGATTETAIRARSRARRHAPPVERAGTLDPGAYGDVVVVPEPPITSRDSPTRLQSSKTASEWSDGWCVAMRPSRVPVRYPLFS